MIRHTVVFTLRHAEGSLKEKSFLRDAQVLGDIPGVSGFEQFRQVNPRTDYRFGFSMEFADRAAYEGYNAHPRHLSFVRERWAHEVERFMEIDTEPV
ncbi:Dabb family protein [Devosia sp.]|uniref:Dabb family protein n=1 Tax=Devosia sp. TaxID=1871048 RepID=UPI002F0E8E6F